jgi:hypothetical protein
MNRVLCAVVGALALACNSGVNPGAYRDNDLELLVGHAARDACSCIFVMEQSEAFCQAWLRASPEVASYRVDPENKTVQAYAVLLWGAKARFVERFGCVLE